MSSLTPASWALLKFEPAVPPLVTDPISAGERSRKSVMFVAPTSLIDSAVNDWIGFGRLNSGRAMRVPVTMIGAASSCSAGVLGDLRRRWRRIASRSLRKGRRG